MTTSLRDALTQRINQVGPAHPDIGELAGLGERRLRRRRLTAAAGAVAAVTLAIALAIGGIALNRSADRNPGPIDHPPTNPHQTQTATPTTTRPIVYSDVSVAPGAGPSGFSGDSIHVGDRVVDTGSGWIKTDVTDNGVVYTTGGYQDDGRVWFTDGGRPKQIGSHACAAPHGAGNTVVTGNAGSLAAWFDCTRTQDPELVVYDTGSGREAVRERVTQCRVGHAWLRGLTPAGMGACNVDAIIADHVYFARTIDPPHGSALELDMVTGRVSKVELPERVTDEMLIPSAYAIASQPYLDDIRSRPRGMVVGDSWETGTPTSFGSGFSVVGKRLVGPAFDTATHRPVRLHLPTGYHGASDFMIFEWLNDDTVALIGPGGWGDAPGYGDILRCRLSDGHCDLVARGHGPVRLPANGGIPG